MMEARFPQRRPRRLRRRSALREAVAEVELAPHHLIYPLFVSESDQPRPIESMPGVSQLPVHQAVETIQRSVEMGLSQFMMFGVTPAEKKDEVGRYAADPEAPVNRVLRDVRERDPGAVLYADLCFCEYTDHGHCGVMESPNHAEAGVDNDRTLAMLQRTAVAQADAGADVVAPSGMIDGQVQAIRSALDAADHSHVAILSYSIKYASHFYGPFREAGEGGMAFGDRRGYQMDYRRTREWRTELAQDLAEGTDLVMIKPATGYLDIVRGVREACDVPVACYHVSGEYAALHAAAERGWLDLRPAVLETMHGIRRAGADLVVTYFAPQLARWLGSSPPSGTPH